MSKYDQNNQTSSSCNADFFDSLKGAENMTVSKPFGPQKYDPLKEQELVSQHQSGMYHVDNTGRGGLRIRVTKRILEVFV